MKGDVKKGDLVLSKAGRDKEKIFLVIEVENGFAKIVDGKMRKVKTPKKKSIKHLQTVLSAKYYNLAEKIQKGESVGNKRIIQLINAEKTKKQED